MTLDKKAVRILFDTYWSSAGWKQNAEAAAEDLAYAKAHGTMFDPIVIPHDEAVNAAIDAVNAVTKEAVVAAFLASLSSRRLDIRSALGSYSVGRHLERHSFLESATMTDCTYCGEYDSPKPVDLSILNFERIKWGGTRHDHPVYISLDLTIFGTVQHMVPREEDINLLKLIIDVAGSMPAKARPNQLDKALAKVLPSNSAERRTLIEILAFAGVLVDPNRPSFQTQFVPIERRERTHWHTDDWRYPAMWWMGSHGVNQSAVDEWFPFL